MAERYEVAVKVISQKGTCATENKVGDEWVISNRTPQGMCLSAFTSMYPTILALSGDG